MKETGLAAGYYWSCFRAWMAETHPDWSVPEDGCVTSLLRVFRAHPGLHDELIAAVREAPGERAWAIYKAAHGGWWPRDAAVHDIRKAPGDRASAIYCAMRDRWWAASRAANQ